ncbi:MAG: HPr family phosphocarrier protein [Clostridiales bacterium]|nr:HPr family phosphocarrier protein [Clostridiales bacterium]
MKTVNILLSLAENVKRFNSIVSKYPYEIDLRSGRHLIDAKSLLGIYSLDLNKPVIVEIYSDDCDDLLEEIKDFMI